MLTSITTAPWDDHWEEISQVIIGNGITRIGANSFSGYENLSTVSLPESLTEIGDYAFTFCSFLEEITLPDSLEKIGKAAFSFSALVEIEIPDGVETISEEAFYYCQDLEWLHLGESVRTIQKKAFACCEVLETVSLPEYIERIGTKAFANCECLNDILIDINVSYIAPDAFEGSENVLIYCFDESYAMKYAIREKILFSVIPPASVARVTVTGLSAKTYTGSALTQSPTVSLGDTTLKKGTDYTLSYKNNINAGTATMTITGKGDYYGSVSRTFTIKPASITKATVTCPASKVWAGWALTPVPTVKVGSRTLKKGTDFSLSFKNNVHVGKATITITGKGIILGHTKRHFQSFQSPQRSAASAVLKRSSLSSGKNSPPRRPATRSSTAPGAISKHRRPSR